MDLFALKGKVALVTGGASGIGAATAKLLAQAGARVEVLDIKSGHDVTDEAQVRSALEKCGAIDILVNNAGTAVRKPATELSSEDWDKVRALLKDLSAGERPSDKDAPGLGYKGFLLTPRAIDGVPKWIAVFKGTIQLGDSPRDRVYKKDDKVFPKGTFSRESGLGDRLSRTWAPNQRVSWMAGLLPYLGQEALFNEINTKKSWRDEENLKRGAILIPQAVPRRSARAARRRNVRASCRRCRGCCAAVLMSSGVRWTITSIRRASS